MKGIYQIRQKSTGRSYIGSSRDITRRWDEHRYHLLRNRHENSFLQNAWNKYGPLGFEFEVLEVLREDSPQSDLEKVEKFWIAWCWGLLFNTNQETNRPPDQTGRIRSFESRQRMREAFKGRSHTEDEKRRISIGVTRALKGRKPSPEEVEKNRQSHLGKKQSPEVRARISEGTKLGWARKKERDRS